MAGNQYPITLRTLVPDPPIPNTVTKGATLTHQELDRNFVMMAQALFNGGLMPPTNLAAGETYYVPENRQVAVFGDVLLVGEGTLVAEGQVFVFGDDSQFMQQTTNNNTVIDGMPDSISEYSLLLGDGFGGWRQSVVLYCGNY